jgi:hypothetical protein
MSEIAARALLESHQMQWRERLVRFLLPRLAGTTSDKETALVMVLAALEQAHAEGLSDAIYVIESVTAGLDEQHHDRRALTIMGNQLKTLKQMNERPLS